MGKGNTAYERWHTEAKSELNHEVCRYSIGQQYQVRGTLSKENSVSDGTKAQKFNMKEPSMSRNLH